MRSCIALWAFFLISAPAVSQDIAEYDTAVRQLPPPFAKFSPADVLAQVFPTYDPKTGRQSEFPNQEQKPALVKILEAKPWTAGGKKHLVVFVQVAANDYDHETVCGGCLTYGLLAVLRENQGRIELTARQDTGPYILAKDRNDGGEMSGPLGALWFSGHAVVSLDLAPYRLTRDETLIGARTEHIWQSIWGTHITLFRMVGRTLKPVFEGFVVERDYQAYPEGPVDKTTAILSSQPAGRFHDLVVDRTTFRCPLDDNLDCDSESKTKVRQKRERWTFDGEKYVLKSLPTWR